MEHHGQGELGMYTDRKGRQYIVDTNRHPGDSHYLVGVEPREGFQVWAEFEDGTAGIADLSDMAERSEWVASLWEDRCYFQTVHIPTPGAGAAWDGGWIDISPTSLYLRVTGKPLDEVCPQVRFAP